MRDTALVTGASGGIGEQLARLVAAGGSDVVLVARTTASLETLAAELTRAHGVTATVLPADLSAPDAAATAVRMLGERQIAIDVLVNNAGFGAAAEFAVEDPAEITQMIQLNVGALTLLTRLLLPAMLQRRKGRILNVASTAAFQPGPLMAVYYATKAYVLSLSEALAEETAGSGVSVTCLCPGPTRTGFAARARAGNSRLFTRPGTMTAADVARAGYDGMMAGRRLVIPGLANKIGVQVVRFSPRRIVPGIVKSLNAGH